MKPFYDLDDLTTRRILELIKTCEGTGLGNVSFFYYALPMQDEMEFQIIQSKSGWELVCDNEDRGTRDMYKIIGGQIKYDYSEKD